VTYPPKAAISVLVNSLERGIGPALAAGVHRRVNQASLHGHFWSPSYFASCAGALPSILRQYIERQNRPG
jgi:putative transposase